MPGRINVYKNDKGSSDHDTPVNSENGINKCKQNGYEYTRYNFVD